MGIDAVAGVLMDQEERAQRFYTHIWPHRAHVLRTARFLTRNAAEAEDLAQEAMMRAFRKMDQLDISSNSKGWLTSILRHVRIDQTRLRGDAILSEAGNIDGVAVAASADDKEYDPRNLTELLERLSDQGMIEALYAVPEEIRWALLLVDVEQMSYEEAAEIMDVPAGTVKSRIHRGRQMLRMEVMATKEAGRRPVVKTDGGFK